MPGAEYRCRVPSPNSVAECRSVGPTLPGSDQAESRVLSGSEYTRGVEPRQPWAAASSMDNMHKQMVRKMRNRVTELG